MKKFFKTRVVLFSLVIFFSLGGLFLISHLFPAFTGSFFNGVSIVDSVLFKPRIVVSNFLSDANNALSAFEENKGLKQENRLLALELSQVSSMEAENDSLRNSLELTKQYKSLSPTTSLVLNRAPESWDDFISLDKGTSDGVHEGMLAMSGQGVIGMVSLSNPYQSRLSLLTSNTTLPQIPITIKGEKDAYGVLSHYDSERQLMVVTHLHQTSGIGVGDSVVTSDFSDQYVSGLPIGKVIDIKNQKNSLDIEVMVSLEGQFEGLYSVVLIGRGSDEE